MYIFSLPVTKVIFCVYFMMDIQHPVKVSGRYDNWNNISATLSSSFFHKNFLLTVRNTTEKELAKSVQPFTYDAVTKGNKYSFLYIEEMSFNCLQNYYLYYNNQVNFYCIVIHRSIVELNSFSGFSDSIKTSLYFSYIWDYKCINFFHISGFWIYRLKFKKKKYDMYLRFSTYGSS